MLRNGNNSKIHASSSPKVQLPIRNTLLSSAHVIPDLAEPLILVADLTNRNKAVIFLIDKDLVVDNPEDVKEWCSKSKVIVGEGVWVNRSYYLMDGLPVSFWTAPLASAFYLT